MLLPNVRVNFTNALLAGFLSGLAFTILQWLFVSGQIYVSKYNAIYGSFAFLPLLMLWMQLVWVITLAGAVLCFSSQNIVLYSFSTQISNISFDYRRKILLAVMAVIAGRFKRQQTPPDTNEFARRYRFPIKLVTQVLDELKSAGLILKVDIDEKKHRWGYVPAIDLVKLTVGRVLRNLRLSGYKNFIPEFRRNFSKISDIIDKFSKDLYNDGKDIKIVDLDYPEGNQKNKFPKSIKIHPNMKKPIATTAAPGAIGPYSQAIDAGAFVYCSGQIPVNPATGEIPEGITAQTAQSLANVKAILTEAGLTMDNVVKTTVFLADMNDFAAMNAVYAENFSEPFPARSAVAVRELPKKVLVEIEVIAVR